MSAPTVKQNLRRIILQLFPFLARFKVAADGGLAIKSASTVIHLAGGPGDPAVARVGDLVVRLAFYPGVPGATPPSLWYSASTSAPYVWAPAALTIITGPLPTDAGTAITITTGSGKVTSG